MVDLAALLDRLWGLPGAVLTPLGGGINSETWLVEHRGATRVAKRVAPDASADLLAGCEVARRLAAAGFVTGPPVPTLDGRLVGEDASGHALALLEHVPGRELEGDADEEQEWMATTLAGIHRAGEPTAGHGAAAFMADWLTPDLPWLLDRPWLVRAVAAVRAETDALDLTWTTLHTDPAPEAFVHDDASGVTGLIDWTGARRGPALYDVASAVMYLGGTAGAAASWTPTGAVARSAPAS